MDSSQLSLDTRRRPAIDPATGSALARTEHGEAASDGAGGPDPVCRVDDPEGDRQLKWRLLFADAAAACIGWIGVGMLVTQGTPYVPLFLHSVAAVAVTLAATQLLGCYRAPGCAPLPLELGRITVAAGVGATVVALGGNHSLRPLVAGALTVVIAMSAFRWVFRQWLEDCRARGKYLRRILLAGANSEALDLVNTFQSEPGLGYRVTAIAGVDPQSEPPMQLPTAASPEQIPTLARATGSSGVLVVLSALSADTVRRVISCASAHGLRVEIWPGVPHVGRLSLRPASSAGETLFCVEPLVTRRWQSLVKRIIDLVGASIGLVLVAPVCLVAAALVKIDSRGPAFHRQERVGKDGRLFVVYKLRSMFADPGLDTSALSELNERTDGPLFKCSRDPRVTRMGRVLRETSIDELPQLWNVLTGSMSLVGPRPALPSESAQFDEQHLRRLTVKPGVTGLWQVRARDNPSFSAYRRLDLHYIENWSLRLDLSIILSTPWIVLVRAFRHVRRPRP